MAISGRTTVTILVIVIGVLICVVGWKILDVRMNKSDTRKFVGCIGLRPCNKARDCSSGEVCYSGACLTRKICKAPSEKIQVQECSVNEKCMSVGDIGYCVPLKVSTDPPTKKQILDAAVNEMKAKLSNLPLQADKAKLLQDISTLKAKVASSLTNLTPDEKAKLTTDLNTLEAKLTADLSELKAKMPTSS